MTGRRANGIPFVFVIAQAELRPKKIVPKEKLGNE
jgi:hypothetical protein